jgi:hypothetical protein
MGRGADDAFARRISAIVKPARSNIESVPW